MKCNSLTQVIQKTTLWVVFCINIGGSFQLSASIISRLRRMWSWSRMGRRNSNTSSSMIFVPRILSSCVMVLTSISSRTRRSTSSSTSWSRRRRIFLFCSRTFSWSSSIFTITFPLPVSGIIRNILIISSQTTCNLRSCRLRSMGSSISLTLTV